MHSDELATTMTSHRILTASLAALVATCVLAACAADRGTGNSGTQPDTRAPAGIASCGTGQAIFTRPPVALEELSGWEPLGNMGPPAHTFPTDHQYLYINNPDVSAPRREVAVVAPADLIVTRARIQTATPGVTDYGLEFSPCAEVYGQFAHMATIAPALLAKLGTFDQFCSTYSTAPGNAYTGCTSRQVAIHVAAGEPLGTAGGASPHSFALDFSLWDARVPAIAFANPARWPASNDRFDAFHVVPASEYFAEPARSQIAPHVGSFDGRVRRTAAPLGGTIAADQPGTAMGVWFNPSQPNNPESAHLAIAPDRVDPTRIALSIGLSQPGWNRGLVLFTPVASGFVNRHPSQLVADGSIYCFEGSGSWVLLARLVDAGTLRLEALPQTTFSCAAAQPWTFSSAAFDYKR